MATIFIDPVNSAEWTTEQVVTSESFFRQLHPYLAEHMRDQPACDRFYELHQAATKARHLEPAEYLTMVRIPVVQQLGFKFDGDNAGKMYAGLFYLLGTPACLNLHYPAGRVDGEAIQQGITKYAEQLVDALIALGVTQQELDLLMALITGK